VGVVTNTREGSLAAGFGDQVYFPLTPKRQQPSMYLIMQTRANPHDAASEIRGTVAGIDPSVPVTRIRTLNEVVASSESASRSLTILLLAFGALAVIIGGVGVYSTIAYIVSWRTREIGIRLALGAQRWQIINSIVGQSLFMAIAGSIIGLAASAMLGRLLTSFLYEVQPVDPVTFCAVPMLMVALALVAAWLPARRAASVSPVRTLKAE
jgi:ABC-type antimicrobial peptide transport system permease subunit